MTVKQTRRSQRLGRYELGELLGAGGMSEVYAAVHLGLQKRVAVKLLRPKLRDDPDAVARFLREGECTARVSHPHIVDVADVGIEQGVPYLAMELLEGETLEERLARGGAYAVEDALDVLFPILDAVAAIHDAGVIHRDIKPANVVLARGLDGRVCPKLVDFGVATVSERRAITGRVGPIGTPQYMSPEQARGERELGYGSDQYSLASMLFEMLTGHVPFGEGRVESVLRAVGRGAFPQLRERLPHLPPALEHVMARATAHDPDARYPRVLTLGQALLPFARSGTRGLFEERLSPAHRPRYAASTPVPAARGVSAGATRRPTAARQRLATLAVSGLAMSVGLAVGMAQTTAAPLPNPQASAVELSGVHVQPMPRAPAALPPTTVLLHPPHAVARLDGVVAGTGALRVPRFDDGVLHELRVEAAGYVTRVLLFREAPPHETIALARH
jgi:tRNA A-37 threonylcarbamoyl transferase component Bud32